jgi:hypothetical protein
MGQVSLVQGRSENRYCMDGEYGTGSSRAYYRGPRGVRFAGCATAYAAVVISG